MAERNDEVYRVAKYSTKCVALDALKLMRTAYKNRARVFELPEELDGAFRFPKEEEIPFK
jgi:hypothetical protein